jgi:hypothetical protein
MFKAPFLRKVDKGLITPLFISVIQHNFLIFSFTRIKVGLTHRTCAPPKTPHIRYTNDILKEIKRKINLISHGEIERYQYLSHGLRCLAMGEWEVKSEDLPQGSIDLRGMSPGSLEIPPFNGIFPLPCVHFSLVGASSIKTDSPLTCIIKY